MRRKTASCSCRCLLYHLFKGWITSVCPRLPAVLFLICDFPVCLCLEKLELALCLGAKAAKSILGPFHLARCYGAGSMCKDEDMQPSVGRSFSLFNILSICTLFQPCFCSGTLKSNRHQLNMMKGGQKELLYSPEPSLVGNM